MFVNKIYYFLLNAFMMALITKIPPIIPSPDPTMINGAIGDNGATATPDAAVNVAACAMNISATI